MPTFTRSARAEALRLLANAGDPEMCLETGSELDGVLKLLCARPYEPDMVTVVDGVRLNRCRFPDASVVIDYPAGTSGGFRVLREGTKLEFTPAAREAAQRLLAATDDPNACLRYNAHVGSGNCSWGKSIDISQPHWQDDVFSVCGMKMVVDWRSASYLYRYLVDWSEKDRKFTFTFIAC